MSNGPRRPPSRVSIVVNNHGYARYLPAAIESALGQRHGAIHVIVVDDGSRDESRQIIASYGERVTPVLKERGGQASALNAGYARADADVVMFLDADDTLDPEAAGRVAAAFDGGTDVARVHFRLRVVDAAGTPSGAVKPEARLPLPRGDLGPQTLRCPFDGPWLPTSGNAFSSDVLRALLPIPEDEYGICADWYLVHVSSLYGRVEAIDETLGCYRVHGANAYEPDAGSLDLGHLRQTIGFAALTRGHIAEHARRLHLRHDEKRAASMCDVANRAVWLRLRGDVDPLGDDSALSLLRQGMRACGARDDVGWPLKGLFLSWLVAMLGARRAPARRLAELFLLPATRPRFNPVLGALHRAR